LPYCFALKKDFPLYIWPLPSNEKTPQEDINVYLCEECGFIQLQNMDSLTLSEIYRDEAYNIENLKQKYERLELMSRDFDQFQGTKVLDIGGGRNSFLGILPNSTEKWVADFSVDTSVREMVDGVIEGDFLTLPIRENHFDIVFMFHTLEHFNDPGLALRRVKELLSSDGKLVIEVPNFAYEACHRPHYTIFHMHISLFTPTSLLQLLARHGFNCSRFFKQDEVLFAEFCIGSHGIENHVEESKSLLSHLATNIDECSVKLSKAISLCKAGELAIFGGGGATTLFLHNYSFLIERVNYALDNDLNKLDKFLCNGKVSIVSPQRLKELNIKNIIILDSEHRDLFEGNDINFIDASEFYA
jgi:SAM-dependent methyltransferase